MRYHFLVVQRTVLFGMYALSACDCIKIEGSKDGLSLFYRIINYQLEPTNQCPFIMHKEYMRIYVPNLCNPLKMTPSVLLPPSCPSYFQPTTHAPSQSLSSQSALCRLIEFARPGLAPKVTQIIQFLLHRYALSTSPRRLPSTASTTSISARYQRFVLDSLVRLVLRF